MRPELATHLRALLIALGLYAAGALVWFAGPLVQFDGSAPLASETARAVAIAGVVLLFAVQALWRARASARRNRHMVDGLLPKGAAGASAAPGAPEVAAIGQRFAQAMQVLRNRRVAGAKSKLGWLRRPPYVYELPWYIVIGAPGAGKTTTIVNSGLQFPFAAELGPKALRGAGGTRNCDWWFTADAVLIDTAGRYTTQDSYREADRAAWLGFLRLLQQHRPRQPINGVILALSATDLLQPDADKRRVLAREMRERIEELHRELGIRFPIYVMVTKCDLLAGFAEFFADFDKEERAQVWGATLPLDADADTAARLARVSNELVALEKSLHECLIARLHDERDRERRSALFGFPQQWRLLRDALAEMLRATFESGGAPQAAGSAPLLRGVYFTSATQEGSPMDRALGALSRALGLAHRVLPPGRPSGRSYFVTRLLRDVVLGEAGLAGTNRRWEQRRAWLHGGVVAASVLVTLAVLGWAWHQYADNAEMLATVRARNTALQSQVSAAKAAPADDVSSLVPLLDGVWSLAREPVEAAARRAATLGLEQRSNIVAAAQDAYHHLLRDSLVPRLAKRLERRLGAEGAGAVVTRYEALKAYLMLFGGTHFDAAALRGYLLADWEAEPVRPANAAEREPAPLGDARKTLREHLDRLLASGEVGAPALADAKLIAQTRERVTSVPLTQRVLARLRQADAGQGQTVLSIEPATLPAVQKVLARASGASVDSGVGALYARGAQAPLRARINDSLRQLDREAPWVLGAPPDAASVDPAARARLIETIETQIATERLRAWDALVHDLRLVQPATLAAAAEQAQQLSRADSPLIGVLSAVLRDMGPVRPEGGAAADASAVESERLSALRAYVLGAPPGYEMVHAALGRVATQLAGVDDALARKTAPPAVDALRDLTAAAQRAPEPLRGLLLQLAEHDGALAFNLLREPWSRQLASDVAPACMQLADGRYPIARQGTREMSREEFVRTFGAGGVLDGWFQRTLSAWVDTSARPWSVAALPQVKLGDALLPFQRAQAIRNAFFVDGGRQFGVRMDLRVLELDPGIGALLIDVDGQTLRFARDSRAPQTLQWPGPGAGRVQLQAAAPGSAGGAKYAFDGPWALLRLFERVRIEPGSTANRAVLVFDVEGRKARLEASSPQGALAIALPELEQFQCPRRL
jgi:type VI secretion system protein ImpL